MYKLWGTNGTLKLQSKQLISHCSYGGVSIADLDKDGEYEILVTDRTTGDGLHCFDEDLNELWNYSVSCSSHMAFLANVTGDSKLEVILLAQGGNGDYE